LSLSIIRDALIEQQFPVGIGLNQTQGVMYRNLGVDLQDKAYRKFKSEI